MISFPPDICYFSLLLFPPFLVVKMDKACLLGPGKESGEE